MTTEEGKALLGSENGRSYGFLLAQHKHLVGDYTTITHVTAWCGFQELFEGTILGHINLLFHVSDREAKLRETILPSPTWSIPGGFTSATATQTPSGIQLKSPNRRPFPSSSVPAPNLGPRV